MIEAMHSFEKNQVTNLPENNPIKNSQTIQVNFKPTTIGKLIDYSRNFMRTHYLVHIIQ